jgi:ComF family protein
MAMDLISTLTHQVRQLYSNLLPIHCLLCQLPSHNSVICDACSIQLPRIETACQRCGIPTNHVGVCGNCLISPVAQDMSVSPFIYETVAARLISQFKYHHQFALTDFFADEIIRQRGTSNLPQALLPVPLHKTRLKQRGYNQSHELAKAVSKRLDIAISPIIERHKHTQTQTGLSIKQRKQNVQNAFRLIADPTITHIAIIDDVLTSGETASAITYLLRQSNVKLIEVWTIARTIRHH